MAVEPKCNLTVYYQDKRISDTEWSDQTKISFSKQTAARANDTICGFFQVKETWDKELFKSAFSSDIQFNWFEFVRTATPDITCGIQMSHDSDRTVVFREEVDPLEVLDRGARKVHVCVKSVFGNNDYDLTLEDLRGERKDDTAIVALYNSESFSKHAQCSTNLGFSRSLSIVSAEDIEESKEEITAG